jgi:hypothetical protein
VLGYQLATLRMLLDSAGLLTQVALSAIQGHAMAVCRPLLTQAPGLRAGDLLLAERGVIDGATLSALKRPRKVDVILPLKANMLATQEAMQLAVLAHRWDAQPSRAEQRMAWGRGVEHRWPECQGPLNACVIRPRSPCRPLVPAQHDGGTYSHFFFCPCTIVAIFQHILHVCHRWLRDTCFIVRVLYHPLSSGAAVLVPGTEVDGVADATIEAAESAFVRQPLAYGAGQPYNPRLAGCCRRSGAHNRRSHYVP